eukprot:scaffold267254_cov19-Tisochrysis_lutea.AAC.1
MIEAALVWAVWDRREWAASNKLRGSEQQRMLLFGQVKVTQYSGRLGVPMPLLPLLRCPCALRLPFLVGTHKCPHLWDREVGVQMLGPCVHLIQQGLVVPGQHAHRGRQGAHLRTSANTSRASSSQMS